MRSQIARRLFRLWMSLALIAAATFICYVVIPANATTAGFIFLVGILVIAATWGLMEALAASVAAMLCFNYFFLPPVGRLAIADPQNWVALFTFLATALIASHLSDRARKEAQEAKRRQQETERLYELSRAILLTGTAGQICFQVAQNLARIFECRSVAVYDPETATVSYAGPEQLPGIEERLKQVMTGTADSQDSASDVLVAGIAGSGRALGSLAMAGISLSGSAQQALLKLVAIAMEGVRTQQAATRAEAARQSEEFKSTLLDAIAHEFKTPLTSIKAASTSILLDVPDLSPQVRELTSIIDEEASRLNLLVTDAVRMSQMDASKIELEKQPVAVAEFVDHVLNGFKPRLDGRSLRVNLSPELPRVAADPDLASMALRQVIDNGLKYSLPATAIEVAADASADWVTIRVRDQGPGIPKPDRERIFDRFYRRRAGKDRVPGSGLGLYIAREIIRAHGGDLWLESGLENALGSEFCLMLPAQEEPLRP